MNRPGWRPWARAARLAVARLAFLLREFAPVGSSRRPAARGVHGPAPVDRDGLPWLLAGLVTLAVVAFLVALQQAGL